MLSEHNMQKTQSLFCSVYFVFSKLQLLKMSFNPALILSFTRFVLHCLLYVHGRLCVPLQTRYITFKLSQNSRFICIFFCLGSEKKLLTHITE